MGILVIRGHLSRQFPCPRPVASEAACAARLDTESFAGSAKCLEGNAGSGRQPLNFLRRHGAVREGIEQEILGLGKRPAFFAWGEAISTPAAKPAKITERVCTLTRGGVEVPPDFDEGGSNDPWRA
jgi:hypothetical protein